ncbi:MAG TPA: class I SAM-dependent methyltransferase [Candidatus Bathyarchaeia archaeon]|nr:class I SAM-dependent methyltransferase [Candidatus Bathyarchaeia archaeon]
MTAAAPSAMGDGSIPCPACGGSRFTAAFEKRGYRFERCDACRFLRVNPQPSASELAAFYAASYRDSGYQEFARADPIRRAIAEHRFARIAREAPRAHRWLDVGASTGAFVRAVVEGSRALAGGAENGSVVAHGIELSQEAVASARREGLELFHSAIEDFSPHDRYDVVTAFDVLEHLREPRVLLDRCREWLAPGGVLVLTVPDIGSLPARLMGRFWYYVDPPGHLQYFAPESLRGFFERHGFTPRVIEPAYKVLTLGYSFEVLRRLNPGLAPLARGLGAVLPRSVLGRPRCFGIGELLAMAAPQAS